jgi:hypothetical protein
MVRHNGVPLDEPREKIVNRAAIVAAVGALVLLSAVLGVLLYAERAAHHKSRTRQAASETLHRTLQERYHGSETANLELRIKYRELEKRFDQLQKDFRDNEQELAKLIEDNRQRAAAAAITPRSFGSYAVLDGSLVRLQELRQSERKLPLDHLRYLDPPLIKLQRDVRLVLYDRAFATAVPSRMSINIVAKIKEQDGWVVRDRGYSALVEPRPDNKDIIEIKASLAPGRYAIKGVDGNYYSFSIDGDNNDPDHCVSFRQGTFAKSYVVCPGGTPD